MKDRELTYTIGQLYAAAHLVASVDFGAGAAGDNALGEQVTEGMAWNVIVESLADAGTELQELVDAAADDGGYCDQWYDVVDEAARTFCSLANGMGCLPGRGDVEMAFAPIVTRFFKPIRKGASVRTKHASHYDHIETSESKVLPAGSVGRITTIDANGQIHVVFFKEGAWLIYSRKELATQAEITTAESAATAPTT